LYGLDSASQSARRFFHGQAVAIDKVREGSSIEFMVEAGKLLGQSDFL